MPYCCTAVKKEGNQNIEYVISLQVLEQTAEWRRVSG
jgi:hypothetical protein